MQQGAGNNVIVELNFFCFFSLNCSRQLGLTQIFDDQESVANIKRSIKYKEEVLVLEENENYTRLWCRSAGPWRAPFLTRTSFTYLAIMKFEKPWNQESIDHFKPCQRLRNIKIRDILGTLRSPPTEKRQC
jgi:hypothetical protein